MKKKLVSEKVVDSVNCDFCNEDFTNNPASFGGMLLGSYAICPDCVTEHEPLSEHDKQKVRARAGTFEPFRDFVYRIRGENNTMKMYVYE